jgi:hypothetical protein
MTVIDFVNSLGLYVGDEGGRFAPVPLRNDWSDRKAREDIYDSHGGEEQQIAATPLLLIGLVAGLYIAVRIGVTYLIT